jgi:hypothetical protein
MLAHLGKLIAHAFGRREIAFVSDSPDYLELEYGRTRTVFDRKTQRIFQNEKLAGSLQLVECVELHQPTNQEGTVNWFITVHIRGARRIEVGQVTDKTDAGIIAARIARITGCEVTLYPRSRK